MKIPNELKSKITTKVEALNKKLKLNYKARITGEFLYLDYNGKEKRVRLKYTGEISYWEFAIFRWSSETYNPGELFFTGAEKVDGTIEGAMKAGSLAYG